MIFLDAAATTAADNGGGSNPLSLFSPIIVFVILGLVFYFLILRPEKKREKEAAAMRDSITVGDEIITIGGVIGTVIIVKDDKIMIETGNDKTRLTMLKSSVKTVLKEEE